MALLSISAQEDDNGERGPYISPGDKREDFPGSSGREVASSQMEIPIGSSRRAKDGAFLRLLHRSRLGEARD